MRYFLWLLFSYRGRIGRKKYLLFHAYIAGIYFLLVLLSSFVNLFIPDGIQVVSASLGMVAFYCSFPVTIKRYHDLNCGWKEYIGWSWGVPVLTNFAALAGKIVLTTYFVTIGTWMLAVFIVLCCRRGTDGENKYGLPE